MLLSAEDWCGCGRLRHRLVAWSWSAGMLYFLAGWVFTVKASRQVPGVLIAGFV